MLVGSNKEPTEMVLEGIKAGIYPESVYKFRTIKQASQILQNFQFFFSSADNFNDPFDCALDEVTQYTPSDFATWLSKMANHVSEEEKETFKLLYKNKAEKFNEKIKK